MRSLRARQKHDEEELPFTKASDVYAFGLVLTIFWLNIFLANSEHYLCGIVKIIKFHILYALKWLITKITKAM